MPKSSREELNNSIYKLILVYNGGDDGNVSKGDFRKE